MKKTLSVLLAVCVILSALLIVPAAVSAAPDSDGVTVIADGVAYTLQKGEIFCYDYFLSIPEGVHSLDAETDYDPAFLTLQSDIDDAATFPVLGDYVLANEEPVGAILYNYSHAKRGMNFSAGDSLLIHAQFVAAATSGTTAISSRVKNLAGPDEHIYIYNGEAVETVGGLNSRLTDADGAALIPDGSVEPGSEPVSEPVSEPGSEPVSEPASEPVSEPVSDPGSEPVRDTVTIIADGVAYTAQNGEIFCYDYCLSVAELIYSLDAETVYDPDFLTLQSDIDDAATFPVLGDNALANEEPVGTVLYNYSHAKRGMNFTAADSLLIHAQFLVTAASGTTAITTRIKNLAGPDEHKLIYNDAVLEPVGGLTACLTDVNGVAKKPVGSEEPGSEPASQPASEPGSEPAADPTEEPTDPADPAADARLGDVDGDGKVDIFDASSIQKSLAGKSGYVDYKTLSADDIRLRIADVDGDGKVDIYDVSLIQRWMAGNAAAQSYGIGELLAS